jgi:hypothetical protein
VLSLRVSRDKRGYDHIYLLLETRRKGRTVTRLLYGGRWPSPMKIGQQPLDEATRKTLEQAYPEVTFDWVALQRTLQQALTTPRAPMTPENRRRSAAGRGGEGRPAGAGPGGGGQGGPGGRQQQGPGRMPPTSRPQMPPRQRPPYAAGFGDQGEQPRPYHRHDTRDQRDPHDQPELHEPRHEHEPEHEHDLHEPLDEMPRGGMTSIDDTADLPFHEIVGAEPDADVVDLPIQPYDEPVLEEGLETLARRGGLADIPAGPEEIEPVEERTFVVSSGDDDTGDQERVPEFEREREFEQEATGFEPASLEPPELAGTGFTRDEFPVAADADSVSTDPAAGFTPGAPGASDASGAAGGFGLPGAPADPNAPPRRRRRRRRGGRRSHGGPNAPSQPAGGPSSEAGNEPDYAASGPEGPEDHDDDSDV